MVMKNWRLLTLVAAAAALNACANTDDISAVDACPDDPDKVLAGACGCGIPDVDENNNTLPDCLEEGLVVLPEKDYQDLQNEIAALKDLCPDDPNKTLPGICGCGVADDINPDTGLAACLDPNLDLCPDDPNKTLPGFCGCGVADDDIDQDGVPACYDECDTDPKKVVAGVCGCGIVEDTADSDYDGVINCFDACPYDPDFSEEGSQCRWNVVDDTKVFQIWNAEDFKKLGELTKQNIPESNAGLYCDAGQASSSCLDETTLLTCTSIDKSLPVEIGHNVVTQCPAGCVVDVTTNKASCAPEDPPAVCNETQTPSKVGDCCTAQNFRGICNEDGSALVCENGFVTSKTCSEGCYESATLDITLPDVANHPQVTCLEKPEIKLHAVLMADINLGENLEFNDQELDLFGEKLNTCTAEREDPFILYQVELDGAGHTINFKNNNGDRCYTDKPLFYQVFSSYIHNLNYDLDIDCNKGVVDPSRTFGAFGTFVSNSKLENINQSGHYFTSENSGVMIAFAYGENTTFKNWTTTLNINSAQGVFGHIYESTNIVFDDIELDVDTLTAQMGDIALLAPLSNNINVNDIKINIKNIEMSAYFVGIGLFSNGIYKNISIKIDNFTKLDNHYDLFIAPFGSSPSDPFYYASIDNYSLSLSNVSKANPEDKQPIYIFGLSNFLTGVHSNISVSLENIKDTDHIYGISKTIGTSKLSNVEVNMRNVNSNSVLFGIASDSFQYKSSNLKVHLSDVKSGSIYGLSHGVDAPLSDLQIDMKDIQSSTLVGVSEELRAPIDNITVNMSNIASTKVSGLSNDLDAKVSNTGITISDSKAELINGFVNIHNKLADSQNVSQELTNLSCSQFYGFASSFSGKADKVKLNINDVSSDKSSVGFAGSILAGSITNTSLDIAKLRSKNAVSGFAQEVSKSELTNVRLNAKNIASDDIAFGFVDSISATTIDNLAVKIESLLGASTQMVGTISADSHFTDAAFYSKMYAMTPLTSSGFAKDLQGIMAYFMTASKLYKISGYDTETLEPKDQVEHKTNLVAAKFLPNENTAIETTFWLQRNDDPEIIACEADHEVGKSQMTPFSQTTTSKTVDALNGARTPVWNTIKVSEEDGDFDIPWLVDKL